MINNYTHLVGGTKAIFCISILQEND